MINSDRFIESFLQKYRFRLAKPYLQGDVMDFGGNRGELGPLVKGEYLVVNYDHSVMEGRQFDTIVSLAVIEHIEMDEVYPLIEKFRDNHLKPKGKIVLTTPTPMAKPVLDFMAARGWVDKENIDEHKHYWTKREIAELANRTRLKMTYYKKFQFGFNQLAVYTL